MPHRTSHCVAPAGTDASNATFVQPAAPARGRASRTVLSAGFDGSENRIMIDGEPGSFGSAMNSIHPSTCTDFASDGGDATACVNDEYPPASVMVRTAQAFPPCAPVFARSNLGGVLSSDRAQISSHW